MKKGFTLVEVLVAVLIVTVLITMAVPMYERTVEKSRVAEVSILLKKLSESKLRTMDNKDIITYNGQFGLSQLDSDIKSSKDFTYSLSPSLYPNAVCAVRARGDRKGTMFLYLGETAPDYCDCSTSHAAGTVCGGYCSEHRLLFCGGTEAQCDSYSMTSYPTGQCTL